jgi:hypothetical protein
MRLTCDHDCSREAESPESLASRTTRTWSTAARMLMIRGEAALGAALGALGGQPATRTAPAGIFVALHRVLNLL